MVNDIEMNSSSLTAALLFGGAKKKSGVGLAASLQKLGDLLDIVEVEVKGAKSKAGSSADQIMHNLKDMLLKDPSNITSALKLIAPHVQGVGKKVIKELVKLTKSIESYHEVASRSDKDYVENQLTQLFNTNVGSCDSEQSGPLIRAMLSLQEFQAAISKMQTNEGVYQTTISGAQVGIAEASQKTISANLIKAQEAAKRAAHRPFWEVLIEVVASALGVVAAALTAGIGGALVATAIGAFMATPAFNESVAALAAIIPGPLSEVIAKAIVIIAITVVSCGLGGVSTATDETANVAVDASVDASVSSATEDAVEEASFFDKLHFDPKMGLKMGGFQLVSGITSTGIVMDLVTTLSPSWANDHPYLVMGLSFLSAVLGMAATYACGSAMLESVGTGESLLERLPSAAKWLKPVSELMQAGQGATELGFGIERANYIYQEADANLDAGNAQAGLNLALSNISMSQDSFAVCNDSSGAITKGLSEAMIEDQKAAPSEWNATGYVLQG